MRRITKRHEPASLTQHRHTPHADYDNYVDKDTLREFLVAEQRGLCCYCLSRIQPAVRSMKIEHWHSQKRYQAEQLAYANMLGACFGNEGQDRKVQHCDTRKGEDDLSRNPADPASQIEELIRYKGDGTIVSDNQAFDRELNDVLNLNIAFLKNQRKAALESLTSSFRRGKLRRDTLERRLREWNGESHNGELQPYCQVIVYWLRKRLARP
jgi:uncharacterized protein (TIGR02646 family)